MQPDDERRDLVERARGAAVATWGWLRANVLTDEALAWTRELARDVAVASGRTLTSVRVPDRDAVKQFALGQLLSTIAGWSAALASAGLVDRYFERRSLGNLWGLAASRDKTLLSAEQYAWAGDIAGFVIGLVTLIVVRWFVMGVLTELRSLRSPDP